MHDQPSLKMGILTVSDSGSKGERSDDSGDAIEKTMVAEGFTVSKRDMLPDERGIISSKLAEWSDEGELDLILTTGGTGLGPRDVTPEATMSIIDIEVPGISEAIRVQTIGKTPSAMLSRSVSGIRSGCLIINLPGSTKGVKECLAVTVPVIPHAIDMLKGASDHPA